jgi:hypothetical protein
VQSKTLPANLDDTSWWSSTTSISTPCARPTSSALESFVQRGGGALWIAGERNVYVDHKDAPEDPLERAFPAKLAPPRSPQGTAWC